MSTQQVKVASFSDIQSGEMKEVAVGETKILLARVGDECFAVGANCPHYGAPLVEGTLSGTRVVCPWHQSCFDLKTGNFEEPPAFDSLPKYDVTIENGGIFLQMPEKPTDRRLPAMSKRNPADERVFVILGGGAAGYMAAQTLREEGFTGRVLMVSSDDRLPYDRPNLSKDYLQGHAEPAWMPLRPEEFYDEHDIEFRLGEAAADVNVEAKELTLKSGEVLKYDSLLIATGGVPRTLPFSSPDYENVFLLRSFADTDRIIAAAGDAANVVVIGASFIGMEAASSLRIRGCQVTVVSPDRVPFEKTLGAEIGTLLQTIHEQHSVKFELGSHVKAFDASDTKVNAVVLENGESIDADVVIVGIGVSPSTEFLSGFELHKDGGVIADAHLQIAPDVYAAGDIAHFPDSRTGELTRIEHWRTAMQQGRIAARNMAGRATPFTAVPFFWTTHFGSTLNYVGHAVDWDRLIFQGDVSKQDFLAFYIKDHRILAVAGMNRDRDVAFWGELIRLNRVPPPSQLDAVDANRSKLFASLPASLVASLL
ncbi:MAG: FAD-dependent oxidoreductase [Acidobacteriota bacterium]